MCVRVYLSVYMYVWMIFDLCVYHFGVVSERSIKMPFQIAKQHQPKPNETTLNSNNTKSSNGRKFYEHLVVGWHIGFRHSIAK